MTGAAAGWPDEVDELLAGDHGILLAYATPARGTVLLPVTNTGLRDRERGVLTPATTSIGFWSKLARIQANPQVAFAFHTRAHAASERPGFVLVQGRATLSPLEDRDWIERNEEAWARSTEPEPGGLWRVLLRTYHWRVAIEVTAERILHWPDEACRGELSVHGLPQPPPPDPQRPPAKGTGPRVDHERAARRAAALPDALLGWIGSDGYPVVVPVEIGPAVDRGIEVSTPALPLPEGGRRAGLIAHRFSRFMIGQLQRRHSGWLEVANGAAVYAPHTEAGYHLPESKVLFRLGASIATTRGLRAGRRAGFIP